MPTRYFAANSLVSYWRSETYLVDTTNAAYFDATYVPSALSTFAGGSQYYESLTHAAAAGVSWVHFEHFMGGGTANVGFGPTWYNGATPLFRLTRTVSQTWQAAYWNGSAWVNTGATFTTTFNIRTQFDIKFDLTSGGFELYINKSPTPTVSGSGWAGYATQYTKHRLYSTSSNGAGDFYSQIMIADYDTRECKLKATTLNGNGTYTDGSGGYPDVDDIALDDSDGVYLPAVGNKKSFTKAAATLPSGFVIGAMVVSARMRVGGGTVVNGKLGVLNTSVNLSANLNPSAVYEGRQHIVPTDPNTGAAFTIAGFNSAQPYLQAA